jgi:hypothetical protein
VVDSRGGKSMSHRPGCPRTPVTGLVSWHGLVSTHRHAPGRPSTSARVTWPMIACQYLHVRGRHWRIMTFGRCAGLPALRPAITRWVVRAVARRPPG